MQQTLYLAVLVTTLLGAAFAIIKAGVWLWHVLRKLARLTDDLAGEPGRPGMPEGRPGVLDRLLAIETQQRERHDQLDTMAGQLAELRSAVATIASWEQRLARVEAQLLPAPDEVLSSLRGGTS